MNPSYKQVKQTLDESMNNLRVLRHEFIIEHVPRLHRLLMEKFPSLKAHFQYSIASNEDDATKLTLLRGKKVIARNFTPPSQTSA